MGKRSMLDVSCGVNGAADVPTLPAVASAVPSAPSGGFGPPTLLVAPSAALVVTTTPTTPAGIVAPARSSEGDGDNDAAVLAFLAADGDDAVGEEPAAGGALTPLMPVPQPTSLITWAALQAELLSLEPGLVGRENLCVLPWPAGEPSYERIQCWRRALAAAVDHFDILSTSLAPATRLRRLVLELRDHYGRQLAFVQDGSSALEGSAAKEPEVCRTPPPGSLSPVGTPARRVSPLPAPSRKRSRTAEESFGAGPSSAKKKCKKDPSSSPDPTPPPPPPPKRPRKSSAKSLFDEDGVPVKPCDQCAAKRWLCVAHPSRDPCQRCCDDHIKAARDGAADALAGLVRREGPRTQIYPHQPDAQLYTLSALKTFTGRRSTLAYTTPGPPQDADDIASQLDAFHLHTDTMTIDYQAFAEVLGNSLKDTLIDVLAAKASFGAKNYVAAPDAFDGSRAHYETFRRSIELYVKAIPTDANKILAALSFLTQGDADAWAQNWVQARDLNKKPETWARFLKDLEEKFLDPRIAENARELLAKLTQGRDPADSFFRKFDELRTKASFIVPEHHDIVLVDYLRRNMRRRSTVLAVMSSYESKRALTDGVTDAYHEAGVIDKNQYDKLVAERSAGISYKEFRALALNQDPIIRLYGEAGPTGHTATAPLCREPNGQFIPWAAPPAGMRYNMTGQFMRPVPPPQFYSSPGAPAGLAGRKPGHVARDCQEKNFKDIIRGLNVADLKEIANIVAGTSTLTELVETQEEEDKDFSVPQ
ncbi:hypothetical protein AURDEDRAFT_163618 [Auricularia subglabra TFB-10046 SS5]|nr:hypothetical protein AURDEDRAFT_163618 [Auricularia subglabra TFB-10046 SS5]